MDDFKFGQRFGIWAGIGAIVIIIAALMTAAALGFIRTSVEDGPLEFAQEAVLVAAAVVFAWASFYQQNAGRMASVGATVLAVVFFLRELELPVIGPVTTYLNSDFFRLHEAILVAVVAIPYVALRRELVPELIQYVRSRNVWPFLLSAILLLLADRLDGRGIIFGVRFLPIFVEELSELLGYYLLMCAGLQVLINARNGAGKVEITEPLTHR